MTNWLFLIDIRRSRGDFEEDERTKRRRMSEGFVGQCILARRLTLAFGVGREVWGMTALVLEVVARMAKHTYRIDSTYRIG